MKSTQIALLALCVSLLVSGNLAAQKTEIDPDVQSFIDSLNKAWNWKTGAVTVGDQLATINVPQGWHYLPADQSKFVLEDLWGNPPGETMGMLFPATSTPLDSNTFAFDITFDPLGYVKDDDADDIKYDELLTEMQKEAVEGSKKRVEMGYDPIKIIGWAAAPYYDKDKKVLHWAKEIQFGDGADGNTLNYDVRVLGRKGVLSMNAIGSMSRLSDIKNSIPNIISGVAFTQEQSYAAFDPKIDNVAAWTIGGLVAGKVLAKAGFFVVILKFIKPIMLGLLAGGGAIWRFITGRRRKEDEEHLAGYNAPEAPDSKNDA